MANAHMDAREPEEVFIFPTSFGQQRLWFLNQLENGNPSNNLPLAARLAGDLHIQALKESLRVIIQRHEVLRTTFTSINGQAVQVISPHQNISIFEADLQHMPLNEREQEGRRIVQEEALRPFHLARGPLLRLALLRLEPQTYLLLLVMHHIISDNWSMEIFLRELLTLYSSFSQQQPARLPDLPIQYADFAQWQRQWLQGKVLADHITYWKRQLAGAPPVTVLPTDHPRPSQLTGRGAVCAYLLPLSLLEQVKAAGLTESCTLFMVLVATLNVVIFSYTNQDDIVIGSDVANRIRSEVEGLIGFFVNQLVLRTRLANNPTFRELLRQVRSVALEAFAYQNLPFDKLVEELNPERHLNFTPLFQIKISPQKRLDQSLNLPGISITAFDIEKGTSQLDVNIRTFEVKDGLMLSAEYNTELFASSTIEQMLARFEFILNLVTVQLDMPLATIVAKLAAADTRRQHIENQELKQANMQKLKTIKRRAVNTSS